MKRAAFGIQMHSGWGVLVAVSTTGDEIEILDRRRIVVIDEKTPGAKQPYHHAANLSLPEATKHLEVCARASAGLAGGEIDRVLRELTVRKYRTVAAAILTGAGRAMPSLEKILAAHPLIHTAEGEFFRYAARQACESLNVPVTSIPGRDLGEKAKNLFGSAASRIQRQIADLGKQIGPPWTKDHKTAALAALTLL